MAEARSRSFCSGQASRSCGGHLQPVCTSGSQCDAGHRRYTGSPFPITIVCPSIFLRDETVSAGCFDERPDCGDCSGSGQIPCPVESEPWCTSGCDGGLEPDPLTGLCQTPRGPGDSCGPAAPCGSGLLCDPLAGFVCVAPAGPDESCLTRSCREDLVCTAQLRCSHQPGLDGESCDLVNRCAEGHFCDGINDGIAGAVFGTCRAYTKPGERCVPNTTGIDACVPGTSCQLFVDDDSAVFRCAVAGSGNPIPPAACRAFYSPAKRAEAISRGVALTVGSGVETASGIGQSSEVGVTYGEDGRYGCHFSTCTGLNLDVGAEAFTALGFYDAFTSVPGFSFVAVEEAQVAGVVNFATMQVFERSDATDVTPGVFIGTADALSLGTPTNPFPFAGGALLCTTNLREIDLVTYESGLVAPRYVFEPTAMGLSLASLSTLMAIFWGRKARRNRRSELP